MSRQYKFRGKRKDSGKWIYGSLIQVSDQSFIVVTPETSDYGKVYSEDIVAAGGPPIVDCVEVDPSTVGEFTGKRDSNGKEIYEGGKP